MYLKNKQATLHLRLSEELLTDLGEVAEDSNLSISELVRQICTATTKGYLVTKRSIKSKE